MLKKLIIPILIITVITMSCKSEPSQEIAFFYLEVCPSCESYEMAEELSHSVLDLTKTGEFSGRGWNLGIQDKEIQKSLTDYIEKYNLPDVSYSLPLLFIGEEYIVGYDDINQRIKSLEKEFLNT